MSQQRIARTIFATTAVAVFAGLVIQVYVSANLQGARFTSVPSLIFNVFCYFTVSNVIVGVTTALLARRLDHPSTTFRMSAWPDLSRSQSPSSSSTRRWQRCRTCTAPPSLICCCTQLFRC